MRHRSRTFMDKCGLTIPVEREYWNEATENLYHAPYIEPNLRQSHGGNERERFQIYRLAWTLTIDGPTGQETCYIQASPTIEPVSFMRLDWNPTKAGPTATAQIVNTLGRHVPAFQTAWANANITRADLTVDVVGLSIEQVYAFTGSANTRQIPYRENRGRLNAFYLGVPKSKRRLAVYDKRFREFGNDSRFVQPTEESRSPYLLPSETRFEFRFTRIGKISDISSFDNGLSRYSIALARKARNYDGDKAWKRFVELCGRIGAQEALSLIADPRRRALYRRILETHCAPDWFDRRVLWSEAIRAMQNALVIPPTTRH